MIRPVDYEAGTSLPNTVEIWSLAIFIWACGAGILCGALALAGVI